MSDTTEREKEIFNQALEIPSAEARNAFLQGACGHDQALRNQIESLLKAYASAHDFIPEKGPVETLRINLTPAERPGTVIGRYKLLQQIGEGGMGVVYMAEQTEPVVRKVALKIIKLGMDTRNVIARFEAERQALALMDHPNIAKVLDAGATESGRPYFVMELVRGVPITEYCDKNKLSTKERLDLFIPVCQAIQHAHQKGIIHRDIKPSNVMVTLHDGKPVPRVIDFGIAKATNQRLTEKTLFTNYAQMIGTPAYMSPEQAEMSGLDVDTRTDVYSLGVLLYELLTGSTPFPSKELLSLGYGEMQRVIAEIDPPKPSTRLSTMEKEERTVVARNRSVEISALAKVFKGDLDWIVMKAIEKDRSHRYDTANGLALDVQRHLKNEPVVAHQANAAYRFQKLVRRNKLAFMAGTAVALVLMAGAAVSTWQALRANRARGLAMRERELAQANEQKAHQAQANEAKERQAAEEARNREALQRRRAEAQSYAADMNLAQQALAGNHLGQAREALNRHRPQPGQKDLRGWEWRWLWRQCRGDASAQILHGTNLIFDLTVSPDGRWLAVDQGALVVMDISDFSHPREAARFPKGELARFSPQAGLLAFTTWTNWLGTNFQTRIHLWNPDTRAEHAGISLDAQCYGLAFSADGRKLLAWTDGEGHDELILWQVPEGKKIADFPIARTVYDGQNFGVSSDFSLVAVPGLKLRVIELATGKVRWRSEGDHSFFGQASFSPNGKILTTADGRADSSIRLWDVDTGKELCAPLKDHRVRVSGLVFWPDGNTLASSSADQTIRLWDVSDPAHPQPRGRPLRGHTGPISTLALLPKSQTLVSCDWDGSVLAFDTTKPRTGDGHIILPEIRGFQLAPDAKSILTEDSKGQVARWQGQEFETKVPLVDIDSEIGPANRSGAVFSEDGRLLAVGLTNRTVALFDLASHTVVRRFGDYQERVGVLGFLPGATNLLVGVGDPWAGHLWDLTSFQETQSWPDIMGWSSLSPDGRWYLTCGWDGDDFRLRDLTTGHDQRPRLDIRMPRGAGFSPDGKLLAIASQSGSVGLWEMPTLQPVATLGKFLIGAHCASFSPDGTRVVAGGDGDEAIKMWDVESREEVLNLAAQPADFHRPTFSADGNVLACEEGQHGGLHLWRAPSWAEIIAAEAKEKAGIKQP